MPRESGDENFADQDMNFYDATSMFNIRVTHKNDASSAQKGYITERLANVDAFEKQNDSAICRCCVQKLRASTLNTTQLIQEIKELSYEGALILVHKLGPSGVILRRRYHDTTAAPAWSAVKLVDVREDRQYIVGREKRSRAMKYSYEGQRMVHSCLDGQTLADNCQCVVAQCGPSHGCRLRSLHRIHQTRRHASKLLVKAQGIDVVQ